MIDLIKKILRRKGISISRLKFTPGSIDELKTFAVFVDSKGNKYDLLKGYRDLIKPGWQNMFKIELRNPEVNYFVKKSALKKIKLVLKYLRIYNISLKEANILEIGCYGGADTYALASLGARNIDAIDMPEYGVRQNFNKKENNIQHINEQSGFLKKLRKATAKLFSADFNINKKVNFFDQDITYFNQENNYDLIISWETLEHITNPEVALKNMFKALKPGGICFHEYNPFFSINGGHSLCTLDFPYGHVRLLPMDFESYIRTYRPKELSVALNFYYKCLNRMTMSELVQYSKEAGFELLDIQCWKNKDDMVTIDEIIVSQCKDIYPSLTINDLLSKIVWVLLKKPGKK